jgi:hypothetical protein
LQISHAPESKKITLGEGHSSLHHTTERLLSFEKNSFINIEGFESHLDRSLDDPNDKSFKTLVLTSYSNLYKQHVLFIDEEKLINRMERKAQIRNTFFRGITTLTIGFSIMLVYWVAAEFGISMPLLRVPL